jgi:hypothetical protein
MEELINQLVERIGLDKGKAEQVVSFLKENAHKLPEWLSANEAVKEQVDALKDKLPGGLGKLF